MKQEYKYLLNTKTKKCHLKDGCHIVRFWKGSASNYKCYETEENIIKDYQQCVSKCKFCFKDK